MPLSHLVKPCMSLTNKINSLPVCFGGLGIIPTTSVVSMYKTSCSATSLIVSAIKETTTFHPSEHYDLVLILFLLQHDSYCKTLFSSVAQLDPTHQHAVQHARSFSLQLTVLPTVANNFDLEFHDALALDYRKPSSSCQSTSCDGCSAPSSLDHFLSCKKVVLISNSTMSYVMLWGIFLTCCEGR